MNEPLFFDNFGGLLAAAASAGATTLTLSSGSGAKFPALANGDFVRVTLTQAGAASSETSWESANVVSVSGDTVTLAAALVGAWANGSKCDVRPGAGFQNTIKPLWRASGLLPNATPVVVALAGRALSTSIYRAGVNPVTGDTVTVESGTSSTGPWTAWPNGPVTAAAYGNSYPNAAAPVTHMRFTRSAGTGTTTRYYVAEIDN